MDRCKACGIDDPGPYHNSTDRHRFNYLLFEWQEYRKKIVKDKDGIRIEQRIITTEMQNKTCEVKVNKGKYTLTLTTAELRSVSNTVEFRLNVRNERKSDTIFVMKATVLVPYKAFHIYDEKNTCQTGAVIELSPKFHYSYTVRFKLNQPLIGSYKIPIAFTFQLKSDEAEDDAAMKSFSIAREFVVVVSDFEEEAEDKTKSPFKLENWKGIVIVIPPTILPYTTNDYPMPYKYGRILMSALTCRSTNAEEEGLLGYVRSIYNPDDKGRGTNNPTAEKYQDFFHFLLWIDEAGQRLMLERYNMSNVTMTIIENKTKILELEVPGLAEKRPSLVPGDLVKIRFHEDHTVYKAVVKTINDKTIYIYNMHPDLYEAIETCPDIELDVAFESNRLPFERMHKGIDVCVNNGLLKTLFPSEQLALRNVPRQRIVPESYFINKISRNEEQRNAVINILNGTSLTAPYIVFGPPGTGKTLTIVEAILQIKKHLPDNKILICAPANAACDMLTEKLVKYVKDKKEIIRIHTENRNWDDVPDKIKPYSNHNGELYIRIPAGKLTSYRIVITTLVLIGKYSGQYRPDHVFIDEAAQALEPEADIAVSMLLPGKQLVLAGDPKQLGPTCSSTAAAKLKLEVSLLERLMNTNSLYQNGDNRFISMLKLNYRAHPDVLAIPNQLFYENQLRAVNADALNDPIAKVSIHPLITKSAQNDIPGSPVEFCSVMAKEKREGKSPSYYNESEIQMVMKYIENMLSLPGINVSQTDIGVITPYIRQVHRIKARLQRYRYKDIEVGTTEAFQGREKRIIIISTVRSQHDLLLIDEKYKLGFVKNEKRMNVALTRAKSKLIVIGNPHVLGVTYNEKNRGEHDQNWEAYIEFCESKQAFYGAQYLRRTEEVQNDIIARFAGIKLPKNSINQNQTAQGNSGRRR